MAWSLFERTTRRKILVSGLLAAILAALDALAVGLLPTFIHRLQGVAGGAFGQLSTPSVGAVVVLLMITKSVGAAYLSYWQAGFLAHDEAERTIGLLGHLLLLPYGRTSDTNTTEFVRDLDLSVPLLYRGAGSGIALALADGLGLVGLSAVAVFNSPLTGLVLFFFLLVAARVYTSVVRKGMADVSLRYHVQNRQCLKELNESFGGLKALKAFSVENAAVRRYTTVRRPYGLTCRDLLFAQMFPRYYIELVLVLGIGVAGGVAYLGERHGAVIGSFGLIAGVGTRAMPALSRFLVSLTNIRLSGASVLDLEPDLRHMQELGEVRHAESPLPKDSGERRDYRDGAVDGTTSLVRLEHVSFRYPTAAQEAIRALSFELRSGELVAILGESGAGKSTLADLLIGLLSPGAGTVERMPATDIGYVEQETFVWDDSVRFNVDLGRQAPSAHADAELWARLEAARLADWVRSLPDGLDAALGERGSRMSGGQRQRLGLARALYGNPSMLVLDEPTSGLDAETSRSLMATLVSLKRTVGIIVVTHDPIVIEYSDRTITLGAAEGRALA